MNVLSLFDGMSCGRLALDRLDIKVDNYYAAEIDKYATQVSEANYPDIIRLGDVCKVKAKDLPKIDLILAGSPCQGFSFAGKQLAFDDPRSALFFEFVRILKECDPKYFLLENVKMKKEFLHIITQQVGVEPILINSALVSAQNRQRYYWTNIPGVEQPEQRGIVLRDVLETTPGDPTLMSDSFVARQKKNINGKCLVDQNKEKAASLSAMEYVKNGRQGDYLACNEEGVPQDNPGEFDKNLDKMTNKEGKAYCLTARYTGAVSWNSIEKKQRTMVPVMQKPKQVETYDTPKKVGMNVEEVKVRKHEVDIANLQQCILDHYAKCGKDKKQIAEDLNDKYSTVEHYFRKVGSKFFSIPSEEHWPQLKEILGITTDKFDAQIMEFEYQDGVYETKQRVYSDKGKAPTLTAGNKEQYIETHDTPKQVETAADINSHDILKRVYSPEGKSPSLTANGGGNREPKVVSGAWRGRYYKDGVRQDQFGSVAGETTQMLELRKDGKTNSLTTVQKDNVVVSNELPLPEEDTDERIVVDEEKKQLILKEATNKGYTIIENGDCFDITHINSKTRRGRNMKYKCNTLTATNCNYMRYEHPKNDSDVYWRKLTPLECMRLQTVPDDYLMPVSNTQIYKMLGNGWTIEVIAHILQNMKTLEEGGEVAERKGQIGFEF
tara:strand:- start:1157 stop:3151 length:1995 start_codon:yes stop_codon:yes gene_type:complete